MDVSAFISMLERTFETFVRENVASSTLVLAVIGAAGALVAYIGIVSVRRVSLASEADRVTGIHEPTLLEQLQSQLDQTGTPMRVREFLAISLVIGLVGFGISILLGLYTLGVICLLAGPFMYYQFLMLRRDARMREFRQQLADSVDDFADFHRIAGSIHDQALDLMVRHAPPLIRPEFERVLAIKNTKLRLADAYREVGAARPEPFFRQFMDALANNETKGGALEPILRRLSQAQRAQLALQNEIRSQQSGGRLVTLVYAVAPACFLLFMRLTGGVFYTNYYRSPAGQLLQAAAILSGAVTYWAGRKVANRGIFADVMNDGHLDSKEHPVLLGEDQGSSLRPSAAPVAPASTPSWGAAGVPSWGSSSGWASPTPTTPTGMTNGSGAHTGMRGTGVHDTGDEGD